MKNRFLSGRTKKKGGGGGGNPHEPLIKKQFETIDKRIDHEPHETQEKFI